MLWDNMLQSFNQVRTKRMSKINWCIYIHTLGVLSLSIFYTMKTLLDYWHKYLTHQTYAPDTQDQRPCCGHANLRNPSDRRAVAGYQIYYIISGILLRCARRSYMELVGKLPRYLWTLWRSHCDLWVSVTLIPRPHAARATCSTQQSSIIWMRPYTDATKA